jgi:cytochrome b6-f complex iron-sulfur subunit
VERKTFLKVLTAGVASGTLIAYLESCKKNSSAPAAPIVDFTLDLTASANASLLNSGGSVVSNQVIVINNNGSYVAISDICTHAGCTVNYSSLSQPLNCPCHNSNFSLNGSVTSGPAPSSLKLYNVAKNGNTLHVTG